MPLKSEVRRSPVQSARQPIARSGKFVRRAYSRRALDCEKDDGLTCMYVSPIVIMEHTSVWEGVGERGEIWRGTPQSNTKDHVPKPQTATVAIARPRSGPRKAVHVKQYIPEPGWKNSKYAYWANIEKRIKLILKTIGNRKGDCAWSCSRWQTQPEKIWKLQSTNQYNMRIEWHWFVRCDFQIFSGCVCHLEQLHAQSPFLFPIVFSIKAGPPLIWVFGHFWLFCIMV